MAMISAGGIGRCGEIGAYAYSYTFDLGCDGKKQQHKEANNKAVHEATL